MTGHDHEHDHGCTDDGSVARRRFMQGCGATLALAAGGLSVDTVAAQTNASPVGQLLEPLPDNWGRWGEDDELGAINFLGSAEMADGMVAAMKRGRNGIARFTLQTPMTGEAIDALVGEGEFPTTDTGDPFFPGRAPARRDATPISETATGMSFADDRFVTPLYLQGTSHVDALGHGWYDGQIYNGVPADPETVNGTKTFDIPLTGIDGEEITETQGLQVNDISNAASAGIAGRAVLLDVGREFGDENGRLSFSSDAQGSGGFSIGLTELKETAASQGVRLQKRDILLIRTGSIERARDPDAAWDANNEPGLKFSAPLVDWLHDMEIPYIGADNLAIEKLVQVVDGDAYILPLHGACLRDLGLTFNEILDLSELSAACAEDEIYEFLFTAAPLNVERGTGAPVNPVVLKATEGDRGQGNENRRGR